MAEALGVASALVAIVQISGSVVSLCCSYKQAINNAPKDAQQILNDVRSIRDLAERLLQLAEADSFSSSNYLPSLRKLTAADGPISQCHTVLAELEGLLSDPVDQWRRLGRRLVWPLIEKEVNRALSSRNQLEGTIELALATDTGASVIEIRNTTQELYNMMLDFRNSTQLTPGQRLAVIRWWLDGSDQSHRQARLCQICEADSLTWLLEGATYKAWRNAASWSLWIHGIPGCGKSIISSAIVQDIDHRAGGGGDLALAYFYFDFGDKHTSTLDELLRSLITQLATRSDTIPRSLDSLANKYLKDWKHHSDLFDFRGAVPRPSTEEMVALLKDIVIIFNTTYLVIDALDECAELEGVLKFLSEISSCTVVDTTFAIVPHDNKDDIELCIQRRLQKHPKLSKWSGTLKLQIEGHLVNNAAGMFRWVDCVLVHLGKCLTHKDVKEALSTLPRSLADTYRLALTSIDECYHELAMKLLAWLAVSPRPLLLGEANDALAMDASSIDLPVFDGDLRLSDPSDLTLICSTLVVSTTVRYIDDRGKVKTSRELRLAHQTVKEFLLMFPSIGSSPPLVSNEEELHAFAARCSLAYLANLRVTLTDDLMEEYAFSRYAAEYWILHYKQSGVSDDISMLPLVTEVMSSDESSEVYRNWCRLFNPDRPWAKPDLNRSHFASPLYYASLEGLRALSYTLAESSDLQRTSGGFHPSPLEAAAVGGHSDTVRMLLKRDATIMSEREDVSRALTVASGAGRTDVVRLLLEAGTHPGCRGRGLLHGFPLLAAALEGHADVVRLLIKAGADPGEFCTKPWCLSPVEAAVMRGRKECVQILLPGVRSHTARRALILAYRNGDHEMMKLFAPYIPDDVIVYAARLGRKDLVEDILDQDRDTEAALHGDYKRVRTKCSALLAACEMGDLALAKQLLEDGIDVNAEQASGKDGDALTVTARRGNVALVKLLVAYGADLEAVGEHGPALRTAAYFGHEDVVRTLIDVGASLLNPRGGLGGPIHGAALSGHVGILDILVSSGADIDMPTSSSEGTGIRIKAFGSPLQKAVVAQRSAMVDRLLAHGADPNLAEGEGFWIGSPLALAAENGNVTIIGKLLDSGAEILLTGDKYGRKSNLHRAVSARHEDAVRKLLSAGANPNFGGGDNGDRPTPLAQACLKQNGYNVESLAEEDVGIVNALLEAGADVHGLSTFREGREPPLHTAARHGNLSAINALVNYGANVNAQSVDGWTALHLATRDDHASCGRALLLNHGADPGLQLSNGSQPIHSAASHDSPDCIQVFLNAGIDINVRNGSGKTPLHWAAESVSLRAIAFLIHMELIGAYRRIRR